MGARKKRIDIVVIRISQKFLSTYINGKERRKKNFYFFKKKNQKFRTIYLDGVWKKKNYYVRNKVNSEISLKHN